MRYKLLQNLFAVLIIAFGAGCASGSARVLTKTTKDQSVALSQNAVVLFSLKTRNDVNPDLNPFPRSVFLLKKDGKGIKREEYILADTSWRVSDAMKKEVYLFGLCVPPGRYVLQEFDAITASFWVSGRCAIPLLLGFSAEANTVSYLGRIQAINRKRNRDEVRAGSPLLLIDQAVAGFSSGTFDITISDAGVDELEKFKTEFPMLQTYPIKKAILPDWKRRSRDEMKQAQEVSGFDRLIHE